MTKQPLPDNIPVTNKELDTIPRQLTWKLSELVAGESIELHQHRRAQLLYASAGIMTVTTENGVWVVPPHRAVWVPPKRAHAVKANTDLSLRNLYIDTAGDNKLPNDLCVVAVPRLLRELILEVVTLPVLYDLDGADARLIAVTLDRIQSLAVVPLHLPLPTSTALADIAEKLTRQPADDRSIEDWAAQIGASGRTLARRFIRETGMSFGQWRQQLRLLEAMRLLADGVSVTTVALELGYSNQSAFITMFRKAVGKTPGKYFED